MTQRELRRIPVLADRDGTVCPKATGRIGATRAFEVLRQNDGYVISTLRCVGTAREFVAKTGRRRGNGGYRGPRKLDSRVR